MKSSRKMLGVTLLEIMLVLAIAAMVVVLSIRYYRSATNSQVAAEIDSYATAAMAAVDNMAMPLGGYSGTGLSNTTINTAVSSDTSQYKYSVSGFSGTSATSYTATVAPAGATPPPEACNVAAQQLRGNPKVTASSCSSGSITWTYNSTQ